jgi:hypothetical protein
MIFILTLLPLEQLKLNTLSWAGEAAVTEEEEVVVELFKERSRTHFSTYLLGLVALLGHQGKIPLSQTAILI